MAWLNNSRIRRQGRPGGGFRPATVAVLLLLAVPTLRSIAATPSGLAEAIRVQRSLLEAAPQSVTLLNDLANLLALAGDFEEAGDVYLRALEIDPERIATHYNLALLHEELGRRRLARRGFQNVLKIDPDHAWSHYQLGRLAAEGGKRDRAIDHYVRAIALEPRLTMPDINPHILSNDLATQALLLANANDSAAALAPRIYQNPVRVRESLFPPMKAPAEVAPEGQGTTTSGGGRIWRGGGDAGGAGLEPGEPSVLTGNETDWPETETEPEPETKPAVPRGGVRSQGTARGRQVPVGAVIQQRPAPAPVERPGAAGTPRSAPASGSEPSGQPTPAVDVPSEPVPEEPPPAPREPEPEPAREESPPEEPPESEPDPLEFEPDPRSTGRLDLRLVPKPEDRLAALPAAPR